MPTAAIARSLNVATLKTQQSGSSGLREADEHGPATMFELDSYSDGAQDEMSSARQSKRKGKSVNSSTKASQPTLKKGEQTVSQVASVARLKLEVIDEEVDHGDRSRRNANTKGYSTRPSEQAASTPAASAPLKSKLRNFQQSSLKLSSSKPRRDIKKYTSKQQKRAFKVLGIDPVDSDKEDESTKLAVKDLKRDDSAYSVKFLLDNLNSKCDKRKKEFDSMISKITQ